MWNLIVSVPDHCLSFYFTIMKPRWGPDRNVLRPPPEDPWDVEQPTETLEQKKTNS